MNKLLLGFCLVAGLGALVGVYGIQQMALIYSAFDENQNNQTIPMSHLAEAKALVNRHRANVFEFLLSKDKTKAQEFLKKIKEFEAKADRELDEVNKSRLTDDEKKAM